DSISGTLRATITLLISSASVNVLQRSQNPIRLSFSHSSMNGKLQTLRGSGFGSRKPSVHAPVGRLQVRGHDSPTSRDSHPVRAFHEAVAGKYTARPQSNLVALPIRCDVRWDERRVQLSVVR